MNVLRYCCKFREHGDGCRKSFDDINMKGQKNYLCMKGPEHSKKENQYPVGMQKWAIFYNMQKTAK